MLWRIYDNNKYIHINECYQTYNDNNENNNNQELTKNSGDGIQFSLSDS